MYKIGNQYIHLREVFAISDMLYFDGCTIYVYVHSSNGSKVEVRFKAHKDDNCSISAGVPESFIERTKKEIDQLILEVEKINKK